MKLGILGAGMIVNEVLPILYKLGIELNGICATPKSIDKLVSISKEYNIKNYYTEYDEMLKNNEIDTIYIAVPNLMHYDSCKKALENGKNVICEKPFTVRLSELEELYSLSLSKNKILIEAITTQYLENYLSIKDKVLNNELGDIKVVSANYSQYSSRYDNFKNGIISPSFDPKYAGGSLMDLNIYNIHFICGIFGKPKKVEYLPVIENNIDVSGVLNLKYDDFACVSIASKACNTFNTMQILGTEKAIIMDKPANECSSYSIYVKGEKMEEYNLNRYDHRMQSEFLEFIRIIDEKDYIKAKEMMEISLSVMDVIDQARNSIK